VDIQNEEVAGGEKNGQFIDPAKGVVIAPGAGRERRRPLHWELPDDPRGR